jgi:hypothetical protein
MNKIVQKLISYLEECDYAVHQYGQSVYSVSQKKDWFHIHWKDDGNHVINFKPKSFLGLAKEVVIDWNDLPVPERMIIEDHMNRLNELLRNLMGEE